MITHLRWPICFCSYPFFPLPHSLFAFQGTVSSPDKSQAYSSSRVQLEVNLIPFASFGDGIFWDLYLKWYSLSEVIERVEVKDTEMDIMEISIMHHVGIVLFLLWLLSFFNQCHPIAYFISLIYLFAVSFLSSFSCIIFSISSSFCWWVSFFERFMRGMLWDWGGNCSSMKESKLIRRE